MAGAWTQGTAATGVPLFNGAKYFSAGQSAAAEIRQDVDVTAWGGPINLQSQQFELGAWVRSKDESPADIARIILEYRDPTNSFILASLDTGPIVSTTEWSQVSDRRTAPAGTGFIRVRLIATRAAGSTNDAAFDQVTLRALGSAAVHFNGIVTDDGLPAGSIVTSAWSINISDYPMQFADASQPVTTATFYTGGASTSYRLRLTSSDSQLSGVNQFDIGVAPSNQAPAVNAGENQSITLPNSATVTGNIQDDGYPRPATITKTWSLVSGPGTVVFSTPDQLATNVSFTAPGVYVLQLKVSDSQYSAASDVTITVGSSPAVNQAPSVSAGLNQTTTLPYTSVTLNGAAADDGLPQGAALVVVWTQVSGPAQATFSVPNAVTTIATLPAVGDYILKLTASDGGLSTSSTVTVTVNPQPPANQAPVLSPGPNQTITLPVNTTTLNGSVQDDGLPESAQLTITWSQVSGPGTVTFATPSQAVTQATFSAAGQYVLQLTASDTEFTVFKQVIVTVNPEPPPPGSEISVNIDSPGRDINITQPTPIVATISGGSWTLKYSPNADEDLTTRTWTTLASGTGAVIGATIGTFDPTLLLNGTYLIRLVSLDAAGNPSLDQIGVNVRGQQKIGNFTLSFNDLSVPVAGLPIQVIRTYDSRDKSAGDFGTGWTLGIKNVRLEKSATLGKLWDETYTPGILPKYCIEPTRPQTVTITFADGRQYRFNAVPSPQCQLAAPLTGGDMTYVQIRGDSGTGGASLVAVGNNAVIVDAAVPGIVNLINLTDQRIYNPTAFRLTTAEGYTYTIDQKLGVTAMSDLHGNTLAINSTGIIHSSGKSIVFTRDAQGRITRITDPAGNVIELTDVGPIPARP